MSKRFLPSIVYRIAALGLVALLQPMQFAPAFADQSDCQTFKDTGKTVCGRFLQYWNTHGGLAQQGCPISNAIGERSEIDGKLYTVQDPISKAGTLFTKSGDALTTPLQFKGEPEASPVSMKTDERLVRRPK